MKEKIYVSQEELWDWAQREYEKAEARHDLKGMQWCNAFLQQISLADHKKREVKEN
jgi:hypothetical protein